MIASLDSPGSERRMPALGGLLSRNAMLVALVLLVVLFVATSPVFGTPGNAVNIMRQSASVLVLGLAMALVVLVGGIDLSVGSVVFAVGDASPASCSPKGSILPSPSSPRSASAPRSASSTRRWSRASGSAR